jgi:peptidoglycan/LPS O-acetylase OafA/YrhL
VNGKRYMDYPAPMREVGALLDAGAVHGGRSARNHLRCLAKTNGIGSRRVEEVLGMAGLAGVAGLAVMTATGGQPAHMFSAWGELAVFACYAVILVLIGAAQFSRRDA